MKIEKCIRPLVLIAERSVKFLLNQMEDALFIVRIAFENINQEDFKSIKNPYLDF
jgi:hypothetical protein